MQLKKAIEAKEQRIIEKAQIEALANEEEAQFQFLTMHDQESMQQSYVDDAKKNLITDSEKISCEPLIYSAQEQCLGLNLPKIIPSAHEYYGP